MSRHRNQPSRSQRKAAVRIETTFVMRYKPDAEVKMRVQRQGLTFTLQHARLCPAQRHVIIAQYRLKGQADAPSK